mgnify:CR=1 FL=1
MVLGWALSALGLAAWWPKGFGFVITFCLALVVLVAGVGGGAWLQLDRARGVHPDALTPREALARKLRAIAPLGFEDIEADGEEFALVMIRRVDGEVVVLGEVADTALVEKAAKKLVA